MRSGSTTPSMSSALPGAAGHLGGALGAAFWRWLTSCQALVYGLAAFVMFVALSVVTARSGGSAAGGESLWVWAISGGWLRALSASDGQALHFGLRASAALLGLVCFGRLVTSWAPGWSLPPRGAQLVRDGTWAEASAVEARQIPLLTAAGLRWTNLLRDGHVFAAIIRDASPLRQIAGLGWLGALVMLAALMIQVRLGWVGEPVELSLGDVRLLGDPGATRVRLDEIMVVPSIDGSVGHLAGSLTLVRGDEQFAAVLLSPGQARSAAGLILSCLGSGPAVRVEVMGPDGTPLAVRTLGQGAVRPGAVRVRFPTAEQEQLVLAADADRLLSLVLYTAETADGAAPEVRVQYREASTGTVLDEAVLGDEASLGDARATVRLAREYYLRVRAATQPGLVPGIVGSALLLVGAVGSAVWPPRRAWIVCERGEGPVRAELWCRRRDAGRPWLRAVAGAWPPEDA